MKITVDEIPDDGLSITADTAKDSWLKQIFDRALGGQIAKGDTLQLSLTASLMGGEQVECVGGFYYTIHPTCARCGSVFVWNEQIPLHHHYIAASGTDFGRNRNVKEEIIIAEDEDFSIYEGKTIDLDPMLYEQLLLAQPTTYLCSEGCKGLCPRCGANLNTSPCACKPEVKAHPFDVLKGVKVSKQTR